MQKYRVVKLSGIDFQGLHWDYNTLVPMTETEAAPYLSRGDVKLDVAGEHVKGGEPLPEDEGGS
jgi:hypothetical protein